MTLEEKARDMRNAIDAMEIAMMGFGDYDQMWEWFKEQYETNSFTGYLISWRLVDQQQPPVPK